MKKVNTVRKQEKREEKTRGVIWVICAFSIVAVLAFVGMLIYGASKVDETVRNQQNPSRGQNSSSNTVRAERPVDTNHVTVRVTKITLK